MRRRLYLMRHADVAYFDAEGRPLPPHDAALTPEGIEQARAAAAVFDGLRLDRLVTSGVPRTLATARLVAPALEPESIPELRELEPGRLSDIPAAELEETFVGSFRGSVPEDRPFLAGETIGSLLDRVLPALDRLVADDSWQVALAILHGAVNRAILSYALTGGRAFLGGFEQSPCGINILDVGDDDWIVRAVNITPYDLAQATIRQTTMELLFAQYRP